MFTFKIILKLLIPWTILLVYKAFMCKYSSDEAYDLVCFMNWKDGLIFCIALTIGNILFLRSPFSIGVYIFKFIIILLLYTIGFGLIFMPAMLVSYLQPFKTNTLLHIGVLTFFSDLMIELLIRVSYKKNDEDNSENEIDLIRKY